MQLFHFSFRPPQRPKSNRPRTNDFPFLSISNRRWRLHHPRHWRTNGLQRSPRSRTFLQQTATRRRTISTTSTTSTSTNISIRAIINNTINNLTLNNTTTRRNLMYIARRVKTFLEDTIFVASWRHTPQSNRSMRTTQRRSLETPKATHKSNLTSQTSLSITNHLTTHNPCTNTIKATRHMLPMTCVRIIIHPTMTHKASTTKKAIHINTIRSNHRSGQALNLRQISTSDIPIIYRATQNRTPPKCRPKKS